MVGFQENSSIISEYSELPAAQVENFDNFTLNCVILEGYDDNQIRELFGRLQRGKSLNTAERLNAKPGSITPTMRALAKHSFFSKIDIEFNRYRNYHIAAQLMLLEWHLTKHHSLSDINPDTLFEFFDENENLNTSSDLYKSINKVLNCLDKVFTAKTPELDRNTWIIDLFLFVSNLMENYVIDGREKDILEFYNEFWLVEEKARKDRKGDQDIVDFAFASSSGTTGKDRLETRFRIMTTSFLSKFPDMVLLDPKREFDHIEKVIIWNRDKGICRIGSEKVELKDFAADHIFPHSKGGPTTIENGQVSCSKHNSSKGASVTKSGP